MLPAYFAYIGTGLSLIGGLYYLVQTLKGKIQPNRASFFLWFLIPFIALLAQLQQGVGFEALLTFIVGFNPLLIFVASFINKNAYWKITKFDIFCSLVAVLAIVLWQITDEPNIAITLSILADGIAALPTLRKSYTNPNSETPVLYGLAGLNGILIILSAQTIDFAHLGFAVYISFINILLSMVIISRRKVLAKA